jgi:acyl-coenzyme A thioesterase PaaI-like protein
MTDVSSQGRPLPSRLGVTARFEDGQLVLGLMPQEETWHHGMVRASVLSYLIDVVAGVPLDHDPDYWTLTTDMSVRMRPLPAPKALSTAGSVIRRGKRSATCLVEVTADIDGGSVATGAIGFARIPRKAGDPPKPIVPIEEFPHLFQGPGSLVRPLRQEAGIRVIDALEGVVEVELTSDLRNPAGTLQGAMVALVAEAATEDLLTARFGSPLVVTDLDLRYLQKTGLGPVRTRSRLLGIGPLDPVQVELIDVSSDQVTTLVYARGVPAP